MGDEFERSLRDVQDAVQLARSAAQRASETRDPADEAIAAAGADLTELLMSRLAAFQCAACGLPWLDPAERWRLLRMGFAHHERAELVLVCPGCFVHDFR